MNLKFIYILFLFSFLFSCKSKDEKISTDPKNKLIFSTDTILFDTLFTEKATITKRLEVTNTSANAVLIEQIYLNPNSPYSLIVNGEETNVVKEFYLRGGDSFLILVKAELGKNNSGGFYIVEDSILFSTNTNEQFVKLISWGRDAEFHVQESINSNTVWSKSKPHIIYDFVFVQPGVTLTIMPGTEIYVRSGGFPFVLGIDGVEVYMYGQGLLIGGTLKVLGNEFEKIIFTDDRLEENYEHRPGLWGGIQFLASSENNLIEWAEISNAATGILFGKETDGNVDLTINNTILRDMRFYGVQSFSADIDMTNTLVTNCGQNSVACMLGGTYNFNHCTFAEYQFNFSRDDKVSALRVSNFEEFSTGVQYGNLKFKMQNSIVWGQKSANSAKEEVFIQYDGNNISTDIDFGTTNIIRSLNENVITGSTINQDPKFPIQDTSRFHYDYQLLSTSPAINAGTGTGILSDLKSSTSRTDGSPDIGAYEFK